QGTMLEGIVQYYGADIGRVLCDRLHTTHAVGAHKDAYAGELPLQHQRLVPGTVRGIRQVYLLEFSALPAVAAAEGGHRDRGRAEQRAEHQLHVRRLAGASQRNVPHRDRGYPRPLSPDQAAVKEPMTQP